MTDPIKPGSKPTVKPKTNKAKTSDVKLTTEQAKQLKEAQKTLDKAGKKINLEKLIKEIVDGNKKTTKKEATKTKDSFKPANMDIEIAEQAILEYQETAESTRPAGKRKLEMMKMMLESKKLAAKIEKDINKPSLNEIDKAFQKNVNALNGLEND